MIDKEKLLKEENGKKVLDIDTIQAHFDALSEMKATCEQVEKDLKETVLDLMEEYHAPTLKMPKYTLSKVEPKGKEEFDTEKFLLEQTDDVLAEFVTVQTNTHVDIEKLLAENPELEEKYTVSEDVPVVNTKKLAKALPSVYEKYATFIKGEGKISLRIKVN